MKDSKPESITYKISYIIRLVNNIVLNDSHVVDGHWRTTVLAND